MTTERVNPVIDIDVTTANQLIKQYRPENQVSSIHRFSDGKSTSNYKITLDSNETYVLKVYPNNNHVSVKEYQLNQKLKNIIQVPEIHYLDTERKIINNNYCIMEFVEGVTLDEYLDSNNKLTKKLAYEIGTTLAKIHAFAYEREGMLDADLKLTDELPPILTWYSHFLSGNAGRRLDQPLKKSLESLLDRSSLLLQELTQDFVLNHGDFRPANIMVNDNRLVAIIDWEFSLSAPCYFDVGQFLRVDRYITRDARLAFVKGYNASASIQLDNTYQEKSKMMDLVNLLSLLDSKEDRPILHNNMVDLIEKTLSYFNDSQDYN